MGMRGSEAGTQTVPSLGAEQRIGKLRRTMAFINDTERSAPSLPDFPAHSCGRHIMPDHGDGQSCIIVPYIHPAESMQRFEGIMKSSFILHHTGRMRFAWFH